MTDTPAATSILDGAKLDYVRQGVKALAYYVDDDSSSCTNGVNTGCGSGCVYRRVTRRSP